MPPLYKYLLWISPFLSQLTNAAPAERHVSSGSFRVEQAAKTRSTARNGLAAYAKALKKYAHHANNTDEIMSQAAALVEASSVVTTPVDGDVLYITPVTIGSQTFELDFDTGSSDLWVLGNTLPRRTGFTYYAPGATATLQSGETWDITFADGSGASGIVYTDTVTVGGSTVTGQVVEFANAVSGFNQAGDAEDGIFGLAFDSINTALLKRGEPGAYTFGAIDTSQFIGSITFTPIDSSQGFWTFSPDGLTIGTTTFSVPDGLLTGIADTGTTLLLVFDNIAATYYARVAGAQFSNTFGAYIFPCSAALPDFTVDINGYSATVPGEFINFGVVTGNTCFGGIQSASGLPFNIYGDIFLKSQFVVFDRTQATPRIGFANQA
ncbi:hypothetical protein N0V93_005452 [Gnomoniopsis smithogilvyi]|uniref:Peptidase A1 domain-containing protein n=1 Tax=Gnomoniopsis smithogilvyi TaxID=1191159 RepID=A0A9W9CWR6_9PEZI|nr:hypothetical protein N0V93_005452 [Gnomoniopsis smithogilvyi]